MTETEQPLTQYALSRLRKLAEGNGIQPENIDVVSTEETIVALGGLLRLTPKAEVATQRLPGKAASLPKNAQTLNSFTELSNFVAEEQKKYAESDSWFEDIKPEIDALPGKGWGCDNARITHDKKEAVSAFARETCQECQGKGNLTCNMCLGRTYTPCPVCNELGFEQPCYNCFGRGREPQNNDLICHVCNGTLRAICRTCQGQRGIPCGQCKGSGILSCPPCGGSGQIVETSIISFGIDVSFNIGSSGELPAAVRRAFDRYGIGFLTKGHALNIDYTKPDEVQKPGMAVLQYTAQVPCADIVMKFGIDRKRIAVFGAKRMLLEVPPFLDYVLEDGVEALASAAKGKSGLEPALKFRALNDACRLILTGQGSAKNFYRLYPFGFDKNSPAKIMRLMRMAINRTTMLARVVAAAVMAMLAGGAGAALYFMPYSSSRLSMHGLNTRLLLEIIVPILCAILGYFMIGKAAQFRLNRLFPGSGAKARHHGGKLAIATALICLAVPFGIALLNPGAAYWLQWIKAFMG